MMEPRARIVAIFESFPEVELESGGERDQHLAAAVRGKKFAWYIDDHHGDGTLSITCKAPPGVNTQWADADPTHYFIPAYSGPRGWVGIRLDVDDIDWDRIEVGLEEAYRMTATPRLIAMLDQPEAD